MKKLFCKLPPLQWGALLAALIAAVLQALAFLLEYESNANYFTRDAILPSLAALCTIVSIVLGSVAALLRPKSKLSPSEAYKIYKTNRKLRLFPAVGFFLALTGLSWNLFIKAGVLWMYRDDGATFLREFLTTETCLALLGLPLLYSAVFYCWNRAFPKNKPVKETIVLGFAAIIACGLLGIHLYFDFSIEMNAPIKTLLLTVFLCSMIFFTTELRLLLEKPLPKLLWIFSNLVITVSACAATIPLAALLGKLPEYRIDLLFYGIFAICMIPAALEHLFALSAAKTDDPDQAERTETK